MGRFVFLDNRLVDADLAFLSIQDRGFLLGDGAFTTLRYSPCRLLFLDKHYERLVHTAQVLQIAFDYSLEQVRHMCEELIIQNRWSAQDAVIRLTLSRGVAWDQARGISIPRVTKPTFLMSAEVYVPRGSPPLPLSLQFARARRHSTSLTARYKTLNYLDAIMMRQAAEADGFDDALFLNETGACTCASVANIFFVRGQRIMTPPLASGIVSGIMRGYVMELCAHLGLVVEEIPLFPDMLSTMDEVFLTNSLIGIQPVSRIESWDYGYRPHGITQQLIQLYTTVLQNGE